MTKQVNELLVYFTVLNDGTHLAVSATQPLFCVSGATFEEAETRAHEILAFHNVRCAPGAIRETATTPDLPSRTLTQFVPSRVERYTADCVAA